MATGTAMTVRAFFEFIDYDGTSEKATYEPISYQYGAMCEHCWLKYKIVVAVDEPEHSRIESMWRVISSAG